MKLILLLLGSFLTFNAFALGPLYVDLHGSVGKAKMAIEDEDKSPEGYQYGLGATVGWKIAFIYLGVSADYYKVSQTTKPDDNFGNRGGTRTNLLSPTLGLALGPLRFKFDYQMNGEYKLTKKTSSDKELTYRDPTGYRAYGGYRLGEHTEAGIFYESVSYKEEVIGSDKNELDDKMNVSQVGLMFIFRI